MKRDQGAVKLLFLCSQNKRRSLTAEKVFTAAGYSARSAGTEANARVKVTPGMLGWADIVFCMEKKHSRRITEKYADVLAKKPVVCLYIADEYEYMEEALVDALIAGVEPYLQATSDTPREQ